MTVPPRRAWADYWDLLAGRRRRTSAIIVAAIFGALAESLGLLTLLPMLNTSGGAATTTRIVLVALFSGLVLTSVVLRYFVDRSSASLSSSIELALRTRFLRSLVDTPWRESMALRQGDLSSTLMSESSQVANGLSAAVGGLSAIFVAVFLVLTAVLISPGLSALAALFALGTSRVYARAGRTQAEIQRTMATTLEQINEESSSLLANLKYLRSSGSQRQWTGTVGRMLTELRAVTLASSQRPIRTRFIVDLCGAVFLSLVMVWALLLIDDISRGLVFLAIFYRVIPRLQAAQNQVMIARSQSVWVERWRARLGSEDPFGVGTATDATYASSERPPVLPVMVNHVSVTYVGRESPALADINIVIAPGERIAVVGTTGSGKSTLLDVLTGLLPPDSGTVELATGPLTSQITETWQQSIAIVPQDPPMRHGSIADNVRWLAPDGVSGSVSEALTAAAFDDVIAELPDGIDGTVGTRHGLSGGQRQRLAIGRALYRNPQLLVLDECTSALDPATEEQLLDSIWALPHAPAVVFVTHRLHTVKRFPRLLVLDHGHLVYDGEPAHMPTTLGILQTRGAGIDSHDHERKRT